MSSVVFLGTILFLNALDRLLKIILAKKTTESFPIFLKKTTKLAFLWSNIDQEGIKVLNLYSYEHFISVYSVLIKT